jgi:hypothetical protein
MYVYCLKVICDFTANYFLFFCRLFKTPNVARDVVCFTSTCTYAINDNHC